MIFGRFGSISGSIWESFWSYFWYFFGPGGRSEQKRRFSRNAMNSLCFFDILRVRGVPNLINFGPGGDFFDVRKSSRIMHRILKRKVRKVCNFGLRLGGLWASFGDFFDDFFDLGKRMENLGKKGAAGTRKVTRDDHLGGPKKD